MTILFRVFIMFFLMNSIILNAQNISKSGIIKGNVTGKDNNKIPFANIYIPKLKKGTVADSNGYYEITDIPFGNYAVTCQILGYQSKTATISIHNRSRSVVKLNFKLKEASEDLEEVIVKAKSESRKLKESVKAIVIIETKEAQLQTADLGEVLAQTEGVSVRKSGGLGSSTRFSLNGLTDNQIRFFIDGIPLDFMGYTFGLANVPVNLISRAEVYKGVVPILFGADALGGAVNLVSPQMHLGTHGSASYQTGSFGIHRMALNLSNRKDSNGFFVRGNAFLDIAKNNYKVDVEVPNKFGQLSEVSVPLFHNAYRAWGGNIDFGWNNLPWADKISLTSFVTGYSKEIQSNNIMTIPYGEITSKVSSFGGVLRWQKKWASRFSMRSAFGFSNNETLFSDKSIYFYNWYGERLRDNNNQLRTRPNGGERNGRPTEPNVFNYQYFSRISAGYKISDNHELSLSIAPTYVERTGKQLLNTDPNTFDPFSIERNVLSIVNGIEHNWHTNNRKLENTFFVKNYIQNVHSDEPIPGGQLISRDRKSSYFGLGNSFKYLLNDKLILKTSYEWAVRMPQPREIFGNAQLIFENLSLKPERSHNANVEISYDLRQEQKSDWFVGLNTFVRVADKLIVLLGNDEEFQYQNIFSAISKGFEVSGKWTAANDRLSIESNVTWQDFINTANDGAFKIFDGDRIPNRPYFFANASCRYQWENTFRKGDKVSVFANTRYVHEFFRSWESAGRKDTKQVIPTQFAQNAGMTYKLSLAAKEVAFTTEVQNITNRKLYDFFGAQRPGRSFFVKITTQF